MEYECKPSLVLTLVRCCPSPLDPRHVHPNGTSPIPLPLAILPPVAGPSKLGLVTTPSRIPPAATAASMRCEGAPATLNRAVAHSSRPPRTLSPAHDPMLLWACPRRAPNAACVQASLSSSVLGPSSFAIPCVRCMQVRANTISFFPAYTPCLSRFASYHVISTCDVFLTRCLP